ncbi:PAX3- and PAX7-binding protein 1-like [Biomphalaria glabrata]|uniref:PAX3- and PAX7-binding protein 1-like n=1 Tax=Biomphalaria glabrata TaxID=6526 RepID=A0A9U8DTT9_BIOGL|nr:PAX3- and PAX7-binding protein 1-like [Biomphalaria glabrata]
MASLFKKPKRNFRRKGGDFDSDKEDENRETNMEVDEKPAVSTKSDIEKKKKQKPKEKESTKTILSFETEEDEADTEVFKVKKSSHSRRIAKQLKKEKKSRGQGQNGDADNSSDNEENSGEDSKRRSRDEEEAKADERIKKLREEFRTLNGEEAEDLDDSDDDGQKTFKAILARGEIPDAKTIHLIRKQRQMARETDNFIPIDDVEKPNKSSTARLVRDDDNDKSDEEEDERIDFAIDKAALERQQMRDDFLAAEHGSDDESDQEREWENQQIRKAVSLQIPGFEVPSVNNSNDGMGNSGVSFYTLSPQRSTSKSLDELKPFSALSKSQNISEITIESVRKRLEERLNTMDMVYRTHKQELEKTVFDIDDAKDIIESSEQKAPDLEKRFQFFQELRGYVRDLVECLNEKVPSISEVEQRVNNMLKARSERLIKRRQQDVQDQCREYMTNTASVKLDVEAKEEQGRQRRAAEREARRSRRRRAREVKNIVGHQDGLSSDDEESSQSQMLKFKSEYDDCVKAQETLFDDVVEDFSQIEQVKYKFEQWKFTYGDSYREAYIGLCLPKLLNPLIRKELILWNPLDENCVDFEDSSWFNSLVFLGFREGEPIEKSDDDLKLLPSIVEKLILPKLTFLVDNVWDPISTTQTARLVNLTQKLTRDYPSVHALNKNFRAYLEAVVARLKKTLDDDVFMPMYPLNVLENRSSGPAVFFHRQSWTCIKLLGNILSWHRLIAAPVLYKLALSGLLNRYIVIGLVSSQINREALHKCQAIISTFPKDWFNTLEGDSTLPQLENLCRYLVSAAQTLHKATALEKDAERLEGRELVKQISKHLINIHAMDHAMSLANEFSFKIT